MRYNKNILLFTIASFTLTGCGAFQSLLFDSEPYRAGFVITKPPIQISYRGDMTPEAKEFTLKVLESVKAVPYKDYKFNENHNVRLNSVDAKSDKADINLHETTTIQKKEMIPSDEDVAG